MVAISRFSLKSGRAAQHCSTFLRMSLMWLKIINIFDVDGKDPVYPVYYGTFVELAEMAGTIL